ncbi:MAG: hypothetical protein FWG63_01640 [Defluviitaleaceae bacterium]|nr:hypothetical protein [Defluviitaleaceae bacterium]
MFNRHKIKMVLSSLLAVALIFAFIPAITSAQSEELVGTGYAVLIDSDARVVPFEQMDAFFATYGFGYENVKFLVTIYNQAPYVYCDNPDFQDLSTTILRCDIVPDRCIWVIYTWLQCANCGSIG